MRECRGHGGQASARTPQGWRLLGTGGGFPGRPWLETPSAKDDLVPEEAKERTRWSFLSYLLLVLFTGG